MPLPSLEKTWQYDVNNTVAASGTALTTERTVWLQIKNALLAFGTLPWTVRYSCNSTVAGAAGDGVDRWAAITDLVWQTADTGTARSWIVLRNTDGMEILIECRNTSTTIGKGCRIVVSPSAHFTGGTTTTRPTATDEMILTSGADSTNGCVGFGNIGSATDRSWVWHMLHSTDGLVTMVVICSGGTCGGFWYIGRASQPVTGWTNPQVAGVWGDNSSPGNMSGYETMLDRVQSDASDLKAQGRFPTQNAPFFCTSLAMGSGATGGCEPAGRNILVANEITNEWELPQVGIGCQTSGSRGMAHGRLFDVRWISTQRANADDLPAAGTRTRAVFGNLVIPWDGSVPLAA